MHFLALQKELESPTFRLGGGRSIQLSYWGICVCILPKNALSVKAKQVRCIAKSSAPVFISYK